MANTKHCKHHEMRDKLDDAALDSSLVLLKTEKGTCFNVEEQPELSWPPTNERNLTQIQDDDTTSGVNDISTETINHYSELKKVHQKIPDQRDNTKHHSDLNHHQISLDPSFTNFNTDRKVVAPFPPKDSPNGSQQIDHWNRLSDEIILAIFSFLTKRGIIVCTRVCKRWFRLAYDDTLWYSMDLTDIGAIGESTLRQLLTRGIVVMRLAWAKILSSGNKDYTEQTIKETSSPDTKYNLQYLDASSCDIEENVLLDILKKCKKLKKLSLESCCLSTSLLRAVGCCQNLSVLNLCMCSNITKTGLWVFSRNGSRITELNLSWTNLTPESVDQVVKSFPYLKKLNLSGCRKTLRDAAIDKLLATCIHLTTLDLSDCILITELSIKAVIRHGKIEHLCLSRCYGIPPKSLELLSSLKSLRSLQIFGFLTSPGVKLLENKLPGVRLNADRFSSIARPSGTLYNRKIWGIRCKRLANQGCIYAS